MTRPTALIYVRKSFVKKGIPDPAGPDMQERAGRAKAAELGLEPEVIRDDEGHNSGKNAKRAGWQALTRRLKQGDAAAVIIYSTRIAFRNAKMMLDFADELKGLNVRLVCLSLQIDTSTAAGRMVLTSIAAGDEFESNVASERRIETIDWLRRAKGRHYGSAPFGTERVAVGGDLVLAPSHKSQPNGTDHDALARLYVVWVAERPSIHRLAERLNLEGWQYRARSGALREWRGDDVRRLLERHWIFAGYIILGKVGRGQVEVVQGSHAPILADYLTAAAASAGRGQATGRVNRPPQLHPLTGILACHACGRMLYGITSYKGPPRRFYRHRIACELDYSQWDAAGLELRVREHLAGLTWPTTGASDAEVTKALAARAGGKTGESERARLGQALRQLQKLYTWGDMSDEDYQRERDAITAQTPAEVAHINLAGVGLPSDAESVMEAAPGLLRELVRLLYDRVEVKAGGGLVFRAREWCRSWA